MSPGDGEFVSLIGRPAPGGIRQDVVDPVTPGTRRGVELRQIETTSSLWQARESSGGDWRITHEIRARRR